MMINPYLPGSHATIPEALAIKNALVSWWTFNNTVADSTGNNNFTAAPATDTYIAAVVGNGIALPAARGNTQNGYTNYMTGGSIFGWVNLNALSTRTIFALANIGVSAGEAIGLSYISGSGFQGFIRNASNVVSQYIESGGRSTGVWYFLAVVCDGSNVSLYVNTTLRGSGSIAAPTQKTTTGFEIGSPYSDGNGAITARLDEMGYVNKALTSAEMSYLYNAGFGKSYAQLLTDAA